MIYATLHWAEKSIGLQDPTPAPPDGESAQRAAMIYSFFATCKMHQINPTDWLLDVLLRIKEHHINKLDELLPQN